MSVPKYKIKHVSEVKPGDIIINLGEVLETEESKNEFSFVIYRLKQKQVVKFGGSEYLLLND